MGGVAWRLLAALLSFAASSVQEELLESAPAGSWGPEPEPNPEPEPEPQPEPKYERIELHSGSSFFSHYDFELWPFDKTTNGVVSYATQCIHSNADLGNGSAAFVSLTVRVLAQIREREGGEGAWYDPP